MESDHRVHEQKMDLALDQMPGKETMFVDRASAMINGTKQLVNVAALLRQIA